LETKKINVWNQKLNYRMRFYENIWYYAMHNVMTITHTSSQIKSANSHDKSNPTV